MVWSPSTSLQPWGKPRWVQPNVSGVYDPLTLSPALWLKADAGVVSGGARQFTGANSEYFGIADNASLSTGDVDFWLSAWVYFDTIGSSYFISRDGLGGTAEYLLGLESTKFKLYVYTAAGGSNESVTATTFGNVSAETWYHIFAWHDTALDVINLAVNGVAETPVARTLAIADTASVFTLGASRYGGPINAPLNGRMDAVAFGKSPPGGFAATSAASIAASLYNAGAGKTYADLSTAEKTAWGLVSFWDLNETSGNAIDRHGSNTLTDNNTVTAAQGKMEGAALSDGDPVTTWQDQSGNGRHATQATSTKRWTYKVNIQNSLPGLLGDGVDDFFSLTLALASGDWTLFAVCAPTDSTGTGRYIMDSQTGRLIFAHSGNGASQPGWYDGAWRQVGASSNAPQIYEWVLASGAGELLRNGVSVGTADYTQKAIGGAVGLGASYDGGGAWWAGYLHEIILFSGAMSSGNRSNVRTYLGRWGL